MNNDSNEKDLLENQDELNTDTEETNEIDLESEALKDDYLNTSLSCDDVINMTEDECTILAQKVEVAISKYEDKLLIAQQQGLSFDEAVEQGYDEEEHTRLKKLERAIYKHLKDLRKGHKSEGFFGVLPIWSVVLFFLVAILTIVPVSPYLPMYICISINNSNPALFNDASSALQIVFYVYTALLLLCELVCLFVLYFKGKKNTIKKKAFKSFLVLVIINIILMIPSLVILLSNV